jgi:hypothetical protein
MRVTHRTAQALVIEDAPDLLLASICLGLGSFGILIGWTQAPSWIFVIVGTALLLAGLKFLVAGTRIHCFERDRGLATIKLKKAWQSPRIERELRLDSIEDVVLGEKQVRGGQTGVRYWIEYVTTDGEHIPWSAFTSSKQDKLECIEAVRDFLKIADSPAAANKSIIGNSGTT